MADATSIEAVELSGSTDGRGIKIAATATAGTLIHTSNAVTGTNNYDEIWLYAVNMHTGDLTLTIEWGGVTSPDDLIQQTVPWKQGLTLIVPGLRLQNGLVVRGFAGSANLVIVHGYVNRITA